MDDKEIILNIGGLLLGEDLEFIENVHVVIRNGVLEHIGKGFVDKGLNYSKLIALPPLVNSHVHTSDYALLEEGVDKSIKELVGDPNSIKYEKLSKLSEFEIRNWISKFLKNSMEFGVFGVIDFREQGLKGSIISSSLKYKIDHIKYVILGRLEKNEFNLDNLKKLYNVTDGFNVSSVTYYLKEELMEISKVFADKIRAVHVSETLRHWLRNDLYVLLEVYKPNLVVHGTHFSNEEFKTLSELGIPLVICPRSNLWFSVGIPRVAQAIKNKVKILLGTDNAAWNDADIWKEMNFALYISRLEEPLSDYSKEILKAATTNAYELVNGLKPIEEGNNNVILILVRGEDLIDAKNKYLAIIKRGKVYKILGATQNPI